MGYSPQVTKESDLTERLTHTHYFPACVCLVLQSCPTLLLPTGFSVCGIFKARILKQVAISSSQTRDQIASPVSLYGSGFFTCQAIGEAPLFSEGYQKELLSPEWLETTEIFFRLQSWRPEIQNEGASRVVCPLEIFLSPFLASDDVSPALSIPWL